MPDRALVVGWDGATWTYIRPLLKQGDLPNLQSLLGRGIRATLRSTRPPYTNVAWPSLVTGLSPAGTGIYDGARTKPGSYELVPTNLVPHRGIPVWHWVNRFGRRAGVLNVPMTYPAVPLEGYMVTGFDSPRRSPKVAFPADLLDRWAGLGHRYRVLDEETELMDHQNPHQQRLDLEIFISRWEQLTADQGTEVAWLWRSDPVDLLFVVFSVTDSVNHRTRDLAAIRRAYVAADRALGTILEATDDRTSVCLVSDHGSTPACRYISLFRALSEGGWLRFRAQVARRYWARLPGTWARIAERVWGGLPSPFRRLLSWPLLRLDPRLAVARDNVDWARTRAFAWTAMGPLYLNASGLYPQGCVQPEQVPGLRAELVQYLLGLRDGEGNALFARVWQREELYRDPCAEDIPPDLLLEPARWSDHMITGYTTDPLVRSIPPEREYGTHTPDGILALAGPDVRRDQDIGLVHLVDVVPTLLAAWGLPVPAEADGRALQDAFVAPKEVSRLESGTRDPFVPGEEDSVEVLSRLRALGYVD